MDTRLTTPIIIWMLVSEVNSPQRGSNNVKHSEYREIDEIRAAAPFVLPASIISLPTHCLLDLIHYQGESLQSCQQVPAL